MFVFVNSVDDNRSLRFYWCVMLLDFAAVSVGVLLLFLVLWCVFICGSVYNYLRLLGFLVICLTFDLGVTD